MRRVVLMGICVGLVGLVAGGAMGEVNAPPNPGPSAHSNPSAAADPCTGRARAYHPGQSTPGDTSGWVGQTLMGTMTTHPIGFASSGDDCLGPVPVFSIQVLVDPRPTPTTLDMARRLAPVLANYSRQTRFEGCARMCLNEAGQVEARLVTIGSHISCVAPESTCPVGTRPTPETIHSHPKHTVFVANAADEVGWDEKEMTGKVVWAGDPYEVSEEDRAAAPVWVVTPNAGLLWLDSPNGAVEPVEIGLGSGE